VQYHVMTESFAGREEKISYEYLDKIRYREPLKVVGSKDPQISASFIQPINIT
jgi:hypothetical protein